MAAGRYQRRRYEEVPGRRAYVDGSAARQDYYYDYEYDRDYYDEEPRARRSDRKQKARKAKKGVTAPFIMLLMVSCILTFAAVTQFIRLNSSIQTHRKSIDSLKAELTRMEKANDAIEANIALYTDLNRIYVVATQELGMVYPSAEQIIEYEKSESEYVRQYDKIPTED